MADQDLEQLRGELHCVFHPGREEDGLSLREYPHRRLKEQHKLDFTYMESFSYEHDCIHRYNRVCPVGDRRIDILTRNLDVPISLFRSALQLYGDSLLEYHEKTERKGRLHYYPPVILTFWSGFETFLRLSSERLLTTVPSIPKEIAAFLGDEESWVDGKGDVCTRPRFQSALQRYAVFLKHGYKLQIDRGACYWQRLEKARKLRDYYTHLDIEKPRVLSSEDVLTFMESVLLGILWPSSLLQRSLLLGVFDLYETWATLRDRTRPYVEQPFFIDWHLGDARMFHCNFEGVDTAKYPNMDEAIRAREKQEPSGQDKTVILR